MALASNAYRSLLSLLLVNALLAFPSAAGAEPKLDVGMDLRLRYEYWKGVFDMGMLDLKEEHYSRLKVSLWGKGELNEHFGAYMKISTEPKYYFSSSSPDNSSWEQDEIFCENLYADLRRPGGLPLEFRLGRQELRYGDGFLIADGTPVSADRTKYFNALRGTWQISAGNSVDLIYINNPKTDRFLPVLHPARHGRLYQGHQRILNSSDEEGIVLYGKGKAGEHLSLEPYYIFKKEERIDNRTPELELHTFGGRLAFANGEWELKGEYAHQFGEYRGGRERRGDGGTLFVRRTFGSAMFKPEVEAGFIYLSGDKRGTATHEGWDPLFSRHRWISALYKYAYSRETGIGSYWTNLGLYRIGTTLTVQPGTTLSLTYSYLRAMEKSGVRGPNGAIFSNEGKERGHLQQMNLSHRFSRNVGSLVSFEYFVPGNFYNHSARDALYFSLMMQLQI